MHRPHRSDRSTRGLVRFLDVLAARRHRQDPESGQATTEFALIFIPLIMVVAGIIYFGIGLNYWLDMNRVANQGARWAAVDNWPAVCPRDIATPPTPGYACTSSSSSTPCANVMAANSKARLQDVLRCSARNNPDVTLCYPGNTRATATLGDPVQVKLTAPYKFFFVNTVRITLVAKATMRLEQVPKVQDTTGQTGSGGPSCT
jgi:Flp pilus assembly protein TadG